MRDVILLTLDALLLIGLFVHEAQGDKAPPPVVQGAPYVSPTFDFDVEKGEPLGTMICQPSASDTRHPDHNDRIIRLVCEDGKVALKLNNVEFPEGGFMLKVSPVRP